MHIAQTKTQKSVTGIISSRKYLVYAAVQQIQRLFLDKSLIFLCYGLTCWESLIDKAFYTNFWVLRDELTYVHNMQTTFMRYEHKKRKRVQM